MTVFLAGIAVIVAWWLSRQGLMVKPWLEVGAPAAGPPVGGPPVPIAKVGLGVFLAAIGALFALFFTAYLMRMELGDWRPLPTPPLLWLNTGMLVLSSISLQWARVAARRERMDGVRAGVAVGAIFALAFMVGQLAAWRQLGAAGYFLATNPANSFFYMLTALHGLHVFGGLVALGRTGEKVWRGDDVRLSMELCAIYWHFLLIVWLLLFGLLMAGSNESLSDFIARCLQ